MASQSGYGDAGSSGFGVSSSKLGPRDLPSKRLLGTGLASVGYETELNGKKCARKDFMVVPSGTFMREAARLVRLEDHINVVKTLDWTENNRSFSLVLEYMDDDLLGFLQKRKQSQGSLEAGPSSGNQSDLDSRNTINLAPFELREALDVMLQIARGMEFLANKGIRHGNLKTKNILVTGDRNSLSVKVADFGLVRTRRKSTSFASRQARKLDMARWTAPELLEVSLLEDKGETSSESDSDEDCTDSSDVADSDVPEWRELGADVYSFAVTCSQILTGEDPYPNLNWKELGVSILRHGLTPTLPAACPPVLRKLLESCWGCDRLHRHHLRKRPSFFHIRRTLERVQYLHESPPLLVKAPADIKRQGQLRESMPGTEPTYIKRQGQLREPMPAREPTDVVRKIGLREPITVEDLWAPESVQRVFDSSVGWLFFMYQDLLCDFARLITETRTVVRLCPEWTQLREELELMLPDLLRIRNRWWSLEQGGSRAMSSHDWTPLSAWSTRLSSAVSRTLRKVRRHQQEENDQSLPSPLSAEYIESQRVAELRNDLNQLAKQRKRIMLHLTRALRQAQAGPKQRPELVSNWRVLGEI